MAFRTRPCGGYHGIHSFVPTEKKQKYRRPHVAEASSLFHPDLVLVFPYAIRKCTQANPSVAMHRLDLDGGLEGLLALLDALLGLGAHDATAPALAGILVLLDVALLDGRDELGELVLVLGADLGDGEDSGSL